MQNRKKLLIAYNIKKYLAVQGRTLHYSYTLNPPVSGSVCSSTKLLLLFYLVVGGHVCRWLYWYNSHAIQWTHSKWTVSAVFQIFTGLTTITTINLRMFSSPFSTYQPPPSALGNHWAAACLWICLFGTISYEWNHNVCYFLSGLFHLAYCFQGSSKL